MAMTITGSDMYFSIIKGSLKVIRIKNHLNKINVFPVPDGDTGSNLSYTMNTIINQSENHFSVDKTMQTISRSAIEGARGNSGVIMAEYIGGLYQSSKNFVTLTEKEYAQLFKNAYQRAVKAVSKPADGSILTVMNDFSESFLKNLEKNKDFISSLESAYQCSQVSLSETQYKMKVLKDAGVVDSGANGFVAFIEGIYEFFKNGRKSFAFDKKSIPIVDHHHVNPLIGVKLDYRYCFELLFETESDFDSAELDQFGNSVIIAGIESLKKIHIHTNEPHEVVEWISQKGLILEQKIDDMVVQQNALIHKKSDIAIITDSIADLPKSFIDEHNIFVLPMNILIDNIEYIDRLTLTTNQFFTMTDQSDYFPRSSMPRIKYLERVFGFISENYKKAIILTVASSLSGTHHLINKMLKENQNYNIDFRLIDTKRNSGAQGLIVKKAIELVETESSIDEIENKIKSALLNSHIFVSVNDFTYMVRGGRVSPLKGKLAKVLNLKPIITLDDEGRGASFANAFSRKQNLKKMIAIVKKTLKNEVIESYCIVHGDNEALAIKYESIFTKIIGKKPEYIEEISPIVGIIAGRGAVALSYLTKEK